MAAFNGNMFSSPLSIIGSQPVALESPPSDITPQRHYSSAWDFQGPVGSRPAGLRATAANFNPHGIVGAHIPPGPITITRADQVTDTLLNNVLNIEIGKISTDRQITRVLELSNILFLNARQIISEIFVAAGFRSLQTIDSSDHMLGVFVLTFGSIIEADQAYAVARHNLPEATVLTYLPHRDGPVPSRRQPRVAPCYVGQISVSVVASALGGTNPDLTYGQLFDLLRSVGQISAMKSMALMFGKDNPSSVSIRVEYDMIPAAHDAVTDLNGTYGDAMIIIEKYNPEIVMGRTSNWRRSQFDSAMVDRFRGVDPSMPRLTMTPYNSDRPAGRVGHNSVDIPRIMAGHDVRTTVMLRNVPNKLHQHDLEAFLNETSYGEYDFMYLRIDFANELNVGYAFINFVDPLNIVKFARARAGQFWPQVCDSNKRAEISYATIQGRDCLIQKFRNSSVMLEHPSYRPKLYFTIPAPLAGQEEPFPAPDNLSKLKRSVENAEHIGLFTIKRGTVRAVIRSVGTTLRRARYEKIVREHHNRLGFVDVLDPNDPFSGHLARHDRDNFHNQHYHT